MKKNDHSYSCNPELDSVDIFASDFILYISTLKKKNPTKLHDIDVPHSLKQLV